MGVGWVDPHTVPVDVVIRDLEYAGIEGAIRADKEARANANVG
jgi:hypothetical protein